MLTREQILGAEDLRPTPVEVPEWWGTAYVRQMTAGERERWEKKIEEKGAVDIRALTAALTLCDESGRRLFTEADAAALNAKSSAALRRIYPIALGLAGLDADEAETPKKKRKPPSDGPDSGSPPTSG
jgi:hypothetical protein